MTGGHPVPGDGRARATGPVLSLIRRCLTSWWDGVVQMGRYMIAEPPEDHLPPGGSAVPSAGGGAGAPVPDRNGLRGPVPGHPERPASHVPLSPAERPLWAQLGDPGR